MGYRKYVLNLKEAKAIAERCLQEVLETSGEPVAISIVDDAGAPVYCLRMDEVRPLCLELAECKAYTAAIGELCTSEFGKRDKSWERELANYHDNKFTHIAGGVPIKVTDPDSGNFKIVGGVGVSGRMPEADEAIAKIGLLGIEL